jgi:DNA-binding HxlR family transcriptional regulator
MMAKARHARLDIDRGCTVEATLTLIGGKWKCVILWHLLRDGTSRFSDLKRRFPDITPRMLTNQLRELEADGLVHRQVYAQVPPKVEYCLSERGRSLTPVLEALKLWGDDNIDLFGLDRAA